VLEMMQLFDYDCFEACGIHIPVDSLYLGVVSLRGLHIVTFLAKLNDLDLWATDVGNAYLEALTKEKVYIIAGLECQELEGHILII